MLTRRPLFSLLMAMFAIAWGGLAINSLAADPNVFTDSSATTSKPEEMSADQVARELANPNTPLAKLTLKSQWLRWDGDLLGASGVDSGNFQFQPGFPFPVGERRNVFFRPSLAYLVDQPVVDASTGQVGSKSGFADIGYDLAYGYATKSGWQFVGGMVGSFPSGSNGLSSDTWTLGPEFAVAKVSRKGVYGIFPNHAWDVSGPQDISLTTFQPIAVLFLGGGWTLGTAGMLKYDWQGKQWTVPLNLGLSRTIKPGRTPWKIGLEVNYYVERSDRLGQEWMIALNISPVVPNVFAKWLGLTK